MLDKSGVQTPSKRGVSPTTISDNAAAADVSGKPSARSSTLETPPFRWEFGGLKTVTGALRSNEFRSKSQHEAGFREPCMKSVLQLLTRDEILEPRDTTPQETGQHGHCWGTDRQFASSGLQQPDLPTMGVEKDQSLRPLVCKLLPHLDDQAEQQIGTETQGSRKSSMFR